MQIDSVTIEDFMSIKKLTLRLEVGRPTVLVGSNGSGKSNIIRAIVWCLTGSTLQGSRSRADGVLPWEKKGGTKVSVRLHSSDGEVFEVVRYRNHREHKSNLYLLSGDGEICDAGTTTPYTQNQIYEALGVNAYIINNLLTTEQKSQSLLSIPPKELTTLFSHLLHLDTYTRMRDIAKAELAENRREVGQILNDIERKSIHAKRVYEFGENMTRQATEDKKRYRELFDEYLHRCDEWESWKREVSSREKAATPMRLLSAVGRLSFMMHKEVGIAEKAAQDEIREREDELKRRMREAEIRIARLSKSVDDGLCYACGKPLHTTAIFFDDKRASELEAYKELQTKLEQLPPIDEDKLAVLRGKVQRSISVTRELNKVYQKSIKTPTPVAEPIKPIPPRDTKEEHAKLMEEYRVLQEEIDELTERSSSLQEKQEHLKLWADWAERVYAQQQILFFAQLSKSVQESIQSLWVQFPFRVGLSLKKKGKRDVYHNKVDWFVKLKDGRDVNATLSCGQEVRVDLILRENILALLGIKTMLLDEVFRYLDEDGVRGAWDWATSVCRKGTNMLLISHKTEWIDPTYEVSSTKDGTILCKVGG